MDKLKAVKDSIEDNDGLKESEDIVRDDDGSDVYVVVNEEEYDDGGESDTSSSDSDSDSEGEEE